MPAFATYRGWTLALCAASGLAAWLAPGVDGGAATVGMAAGLLLLAEFVAGVVWLASRLARRELPERAQMAWFTGAWAVGAALLVWGRPW